eukprot:9420258-Alexandrium_andersonii.AAC.1
MAVSTGKAGIVDATALTIASACFATHTVSLFRIALGPMIHAIGVACPAAIVFPFWRFRLSQHVL